ncbi:hypothetical protein [Catellatospora citrea]|nr:hypothetical protein [Catellatospora citrea]
MVLLQPHLDPAKCPNAGGNGNASAFSDPQWDFYLIAVLAGWLLSIVVEQLLPVTWRHRARSDIAARGLAAVLSATGASCVLICSVLTVCR